MAALSLGLAAACGGGDARTIDAGVDHDAPGDPDAAATPDAGEVDAAADAAPAVDAAPADAGSVDAGATNPPMLWLAGINGSESHLELIDTGPPNPF